LPPHDSKVVLRRRRGPILHMRRRAPTRSRRRMWRRCLTNCHRAVQKYVLVLRVGRFHAPLQDVAKVEENDENETVADRGGSGSSDGPGKLPRETKAQHTPQCAQSPLALRRFWKRMPLNAMRHARCLPLAVRSHSGYTVMSLFLCATTGGTWDRVAPHVACVCARSCSHHRITVISQRARRTTDLAQPNPRSAVSVPSSTSPVC
jgi:hypothetical protein